MSAAAAADTACAARAMDATLAIDIGNTRLKWGVRARGARGFGAWHASGALGLDQLGEFAPRLSALAIARVVIANVAGASVARALEQALAGHGAPLHWVRACAAQCGVRSRYDDPAQLGADRWAALIAARRAHPGPCLVVNAGTATTLDVLDGTGEFAGGAILPGLRMMRAALSQRTAQLPDAEGRYLPLPRNTADAIASGCVHAQLGAIARMWAPLAPQAQALCLVSGGAGRALFEHLDLPARYIDNLTLEGVALIGAALAGETSEAC